MGVIAPNSAEPAPAPPDCRTCGACCATFDVWLMEDDRDRFERSPGLLPLTVVYRTAGASGDWRFLRRDEASGFCSALDGRLGDCRCSIYESRPTLCREFEAGSPDCLEVRRRHGFDGAAGRSGEA